MSQPAAAERGADLAARYLEVRRASEALAESLSPEDCTPQSMPDASPVKWHLAHTTWFFTTFVLEAALPGYALPDPAWRVLFNSYYQSVGEQHLRPERGLVTRPGVEEVRAWRRRVDDEVAGLLARDGLAPEQRAVLELGLHHEQQHQELILTDLKHLLAKSPLHPVYRPRPGEPGPGSGGEQAPAPLVWCKGAEGVHEVGHAGPGFAFDNEGPRHRVFLHGFEVASRPVTNAEYREFIADGGYRRPELWLSDGWATVQQRRWRAPLYWEEGGDAPLQFTLAGLRPVVGDEPVTHVSAYEADAYARWAGARLPTEQEWEVLAAAEPVRGHFADAGRLHPAPAPQDGGVPAQLYGDVWEWTQSAYAAYPGYRPTAGALGEYNGKFMANQLVLRGGSCVTPPGHLRATYRNFFYPDARWQFSGIRLARDAG